MLFLLALLFLLLLPGSALLTPGGAESLQTGSQRVSRDTKPQSIKVLISEPCAQGDSSDGGQGKEVDLEVGSPLVLTHRIRLVPAPGSGSCGGCEADFAALRARLERLEREVSTLREKCGGPEGGCCTSQQSQGSGCTTVRPETCPDDCSDQGRCKGGKCVCFPGFSGPDCSLSSCPGNCHNKGKCVNGQCVCDPGFTGPDCSASACPDNCNNRGKCVNGKCVCDSGFTGPECSTSACPDNCNNRGKCVNGKCVCDSGFTGPECSASACPNNCNNKGRCVNGRCVCDSGFTGPECSASACPNNCNNKGRCVNGRCVCDSGFTGPECSASACPNNCNNKGRCVNGRCVCDSGFTGPECSASTCPNNCNNKGRCVNGRCVCDSGFIGPECSASACPNNCNNKGRCVNGRCVCDAGFIGPDCSASACPDNCNNRGKCVNGKCVCDSGFTGLDCSTKGCPGNCNNKGRCVNGKCVCDSGFTGPDCSSQSCPGNCNRKGRCVNGQCVCDPGFTGPDCSTKACPDNCSDRGRCVNGKCVCDSGFTGPDCSSQSCPGNCNRKGRCVNGQCVCDPGFTGPDCSTKACPDNCSDRGRCVNGKCVCDSGFTGPSCAAKSCPGNCSNRGKCVNGQCVCDSGFTGPACSAKACPNNCSNKGRCVNGRCACDVGFSGQDCGTKSCPNNCSNKGRCVKGRCVCRRGFTGPDCSECEAGFTGADCGTALSGVSRLSTRDITESSVTLFWTHPAVQYDIFHITFTSQKEGDQKITSQVGGRLTTFVQTGLAAGQEYTVTIRGEKERKMGAESTTEFSTLISGPTNLRVVKTTTTSAVVQWEQAQGEIDRYHLSVSQAEGSRDGSQEMTLPPERDSAQIDGLDPGRLYDISLVAEREEAKSQPATVQVTPGNSTKTVTRVTMETVTMQVAPGRNGSEGEPAGKTKPDRTALYRKNEERAELERRKLWRGQGPRLNEDTNKTKEDTPARPVPARPLLKWKDRVFPRPGGRPDLIRKPNSPGPVRFNGTRIGIGGRRVGPGPFKPPGGRYPVAGAKTKKTNGADSEPKPPVIGDKTSALTVTEASLKPSAEEEMEGTHSRAEPAKGILKHGTQTSATGKQTVIRGSTDPTGPTGSPKSEETSGNRTELVEEVLEQMNGTAHGKKCLKVHKVIVGYRKVHVNGTSKGKVPALSRNTTGTDSHVNESEDYHEETQLHTSKIHTDEVTGLLGKVPKHTGASSAEQATVGEGASILSASVSPTGHSTKPKLSERTLVVKTLGADAEREPYPSHNSTYPPPPPSLLLPTPHPRSSVAQSERDDALAKTEHSSRGRHPVRTASSVPVLPSRSSGFTREETSSVRGRASSSTESASSESASASSEPASSSEKLPVTEASKEEQRSGGSREEQRAGGNREEQREEQSEGSREVQRAGGSREVQRVGGGSREVQTTGGSREDQRAAGSREGETFGTKEEKTRAGGPPTFRRPPPKGTYPRRPHMGPFLNRTRPNLRPPLHPSRGPIRRPFPPRVTHGGNSTLSRAPPSQPGKLGIYNASQTGANSRLRPNVVLRRKNDTASKPAPKGHTKVRHHNGTAIQKGQLTGHHDDQSKTGSRTADSIDTTSQPNGTHDRIAGETGEPLDHVGVRNITSRGFTLIWGAPKGMFKNFIVTRSEYGGGTEEGKEDEESQEKEEGGGTEETEEEEEVEEGDEEDKNEKTASLSPGKGSREQSQLDTGSTPVNVNGGNVKKFSKVLPGSARSFPFKDLHPQTRYSVSLFGKGPGLHSKIHSLVIITGPEPPSNLLFNGVTESSLTVSWTRPKSPVSGFKVTYTHTQDGEPVSTALDATGSTLAISMLSPGSSYEVSVISVLGLDESDPIKDMVLTLPDPPTDLRAINVTDTKGLLLWRPALATVDHYVIVYGPEKGSGSEVTITVSGNAAEQQLKALQASTEYTVMVLSQLGNLRSSGASTIFTTTSGSDGRGESPRDLTASQVTPRSAVLSWKPPSSAVRSYRLTYQTEGQDIKEVTLDPTVTEHKLTRLHPISKYSVQLQGERGGLYTAAISAEFTTGHLRFPFPTDCSQELLNGMQESGESEIFPGGKDGKPVMVYCDMETDGGGWTVFQRRRNGKTNFFRSWREYSSGFGDLSGEFWLGNELLHNLTKMIPVSMRVDLRAGGKSVFAHYSTFTVDTQRKHYTLRLSGYSGTAGDSMTYHSGRPFSTHDRDPRPFITRCAMSYRGGWWYKNCHEANLNGLYNTDTNHQGVIWTEWKGKDFSIPFTEMKFRPASFQPPTQG